MANLTTDEVTFTVSRSMLLDKAKVFLLESYGCSPKNMATQAERDHFHERLGLLFLFVAHVTPTFEEQSRG